MSKIVIRDQTTDIVVHEIDTSDLAPGAKERAFYGVCRQTDLDRFFVEEEE